MTSSPTLSTLLKDPAYRSYFTKPAVIPKGIFHPAPFRVWGITTQSRWAGTTAVDYADAFNKVKVMIKSKKFQDISISSRVVGFPAPESLRLHYKSDGYDWCLMCRRPVVFEPRERHHALRKDLHCYFADFPVCPYCGIREETMISPGMITMGKI